MYGRFETGLKLLSSSQSADGFLRIGVTMADLSVGGTYEAWRDELINTVIMVVVPAPLPANLSFMM